MQIKAFIIATMLAATCGQVSAKNSTITETCREVGMLSMHVMKYRIAGYPKAFSEKAIKPITDDPKSSDYGNKALATVLNQVVNNAFSYKLPQTKDASSLTKPVMAFMSDQEQMCVKSLTASKR